MDSLDLKYSFFYVDSKKRSLESFPWVAGSGF